MQKGDIAMKKTNQLNRREFLASAGAAAASVPYLIPSGVLAAAGRAGANERITMAHIGVGGMGGHHLRDMVGRRDRGQVNIAAVCDIDKNRLVNALKTAGEGVQPYHDYRYILQRKDIDAVVIATPDHWHGVQMVHAAECGKHVVCLVELKARFDEARNIQWAQMLEESGVHVVYGIPGLKTHAKALIIVREEGDEIRCYAHFGTGNYHYKTANLYTDIGVFTARPEFTSELMDLFNYLTGRSLKADYSKLLVAPFNICIYNF